MRLIRFLLLAIVLAPLHAIAQQASAVRPPFVVEQTYWIKPGKELRFIGLFERNRVPLLRAALKDGRALWVRMSRPHFNAANEQWDLRVTVAWRDPESAVEPISQAKTQLTTEQLIIEELLLERTDIPVQEWNLDGAGAP